MALIVDSGTVGTPFETPPTGGEAPFVGRQDELAVLQEALIGAHQGSLRVVAVEGAAGIGKTSLLQHFLNQIEPTTVLWCSGDEDERALPWGLLHHLAGVARAVGLPRHTDELIGLEPDTDPLLIGCHLHNFLKENERAIVVIDDAHWADRQSLAAVRFACRRLVAGQILVVVTYRPDDPGRPGEEWRRLFVERGARVRLGGLSMPELRQLAGSVLGLPLSRRAAIRLFEQTSGHPSHTVSLLEQLPPATFERTEGPLPAPYELAKTVSRRLNSCGAATRDLVTFASVLGTTCRVVDLRAVLAIDAFTEALEEAIEAGLLREVPGTGGSEVGFSDLLVRTAVYETLRPRQRRELHTAASVTLTGRAALQHQAAASVAPDPDLAAEAEGYGLEDLSAGCYRRGAMELNLALGLTPPGPARRSRLLGAIEALLVSGDVPGAESLAKELVGLPTDAWWGYVKGYLDLVLGSVADAEALLVRARFSLQNASYPDGAPADLGARVASLLAVVGMMRLDCSPILRFSEEALEGRAIKDGALTLALCSKALGLALAGRANEALSVLQRADTQRDTRARDNLVARGIVRLWTDHLEDAYADLSLAVEEARRGPPISLSQAAGFLGHVAFRRGMLPEAVQHGEAAVVTATDTGHYVELPVLHALAALPRSARAEFEQAELHLELAGKWAERTGTRSARAHVSAARAYLAQAQDDADALYTAAVEFTESYGPLEPGVHATGPILAQALVALGRLDEASSALDDFENVLSETGRLSGRAATARVRGQLVAALGNWEGAERLFAESAEVSEKLGMPVASAHLHLAWGMAATRAGKRKTGARELVLGRSMSERLGARAYALLAERALETLGIVGAEASLIGGGLLTAKEDAVVRLAMSGSSNAEIAARLVVNVKTVEYHLTHIYAKLRVSSRRELTTRVSELTTAIPGSVVADC